MIDELPYLLQRSSEIPGLLQQFHLRADSETVLRRIGLWGRGSVQSVQDESLVEYYRTLWSGYDDWVYKHYSAGEVLGVDTNRTDVVNNPEGAARVLREVERALAAAGDRG